MAERHLDLVAIVEALHVFIARDRRYRMIELFVKRQLLLATLLVVWSSVACSQTPPTASEAAAGVVTLSQLEWYLPTIENFDMSGFNDLVR